MTELWGEEVKAELQEFRADLPKLTDSAGGLLYCRPGEVHEKGVIENLVGYVRRNFLVPLPSVSSLEELNAILQERCQAGLNRELRGHGQSVAHAWEEEQHFLPVPSRGWPCCLSRPAKASLACLVSVDSNRYSAPGAFAGPPRPGAGLRGPGGDHLLT